MSNVLLQKQVTLLVFNRSTNKVERYNEIKKLLNIIIPSIREYLDGSKNVSQFGEFVKNAINEWKTAIAELNNLDQRLPRQKLFQDFALSIHAHTKDTLLIDEAYNFGAWAEEKFTAGKHPFWSGFLKKAVLQPLKIDSKALLPLMFIPAEIVLHTLDDYIDTKHASITESSLDIGLAIVSLIVLPIFLKTLASQQNLSNNTALDSALSFYNAFEDTIKVPQVEDETPSKLKEVWGDKEKELEAAAFNIDFRTRATTGVFLKPLVSMFTKCGNDIQKIWDTLWLARATEMNAKDAVFDVEADILNNDYTPASVWGEEYGVGTEEWCKRVESLNKRYMTLWLQMIKNESLLPNKVIDEINNRVLKNNFLIQSLIPAKVTDLPKALKSAKKIYMVGSGKGGVGKSTVSWLIANGLRDCGYKVGLLDADIWGPSQGLLFRNNNKVSFNDNVLIPGAIDNVTIVTLSQFIEDDNAIMLRSIIAADILKKLVASVNWPDIDYLIIDTPPGASDIHIKLCSLFPELEIILVSLPQPLAMSVTARTISVYTSLNKNIKGLVYNITDFYSAKVNYTANAHLK